MKRLTFDGLFCDIAKCENTPGGTFCEAGTCTIRRVWERLKEYEDTGLEPEDLKKAFDERAIEEAIEWMQEEKESFERAPDLNGCPMTECWQKAIDVYDMAISDLRQHEHFRDITKKVEPLTMDELSKRNDPVFVPIKDFPNGGYWCLCENGYIIPPSGHGFMAKERPNWVFYRQKPEEGTV